MTPAFPHSARVSELEAAHAAVEAGDWVGIPKRLSPPNEHALMIGAFAGSLSGAEQLHAKTLPGWGWRVGQCHLSDDAAVFPNFNCPVHGDRLHAQFDEATDWFGLTDVDQRPAGNPARAWLLSILRALILIEKGQK